MFEEKKARFSIFRASFLVLIAILAFGGFLRTYHFPDWLHFELDQARDARVVDNATMNGPGELTLLGMKAGGTSLRLGPGFYYLEYLSGLIFGDDPQGLATFIPILSVLSIGLFYLFSRRFFGVALSLGLTLLFAVSVYLVMYGRFAWNPNPIPFFALLGFYALLRSVEPGAKYPGRWFVLSAFAIGLSTHLHFLAFLSLPVVGAIFLLVRRPKFSWRAWLIAFAAFFVLYVPVALNEIETDGANSKAFFRAVTEKSSKEEHSLPAKLVKNVIEHGLGYLVVTTGYEGGDFFRFKYDETGIRTTCNARCQNGWIVGAGSIVVFALGFLALVALWWREHDRKKSDMLLLAGIWFAVGFLLFLPLSYGISPRFFLVTAPIPFLFLGFLSVAAMRICPWKKTMQMFVAIGITGLVLSNLWYLSARFRQLSIASTEAISTPADRILKEKTRVTFEQQERIVAYLKERSEASGSPIYMWSEPEHRRALKYLLERAGVQNDVLGIGRVYEEGIFVLILRSGSDLYDGMKKYLTKYDVVTMHSYGTLTMIEFSPKPEAIEAKRQVFKDSGKVNDNPSALPRYTWREWWERKNDSSNDDPEDEE